MKRIDVGQAITILANVGVIAGIVFLAIELQQNNELLSDEAQRARAQSFRENMEAFADNAELWVKEESGETLTAAEAFRLDRLWMINLWGYQTAFQQLPVREIQGGAEFFRRYYPTRQSLRTTWDENRDAFQPEFVQYMEENVFKR